MTGDLKGLYAIILEVLESTQVTIGKLGKYTFIPGYYIYVGKGSGKGSSSIKERIKRHTSKNKKVFWHIDYLTLTSPIKIKAAILAATAIESECALSLYLLRTFGGNYAVKGFGSSDCRCPGHLIFLPLKKIKKSELDLKDIVSITSTTFSRLHMKPQVLYLRKG